MLDYIVVGNGIAGSLIAYELAKAGKKIHVLSDDKRPTSSKVAGGMFNPVTGRHLAKTWLADELFPFLKTYYTELEKKLNSRFFHQTGLFRPYVNEKQKIQFLKAVEKHEIGKYVSALPQDEKLSDIIEQELGGLYTEVAGWVDVPELISAIQHYLISTANYTSEVFDYQQLKIEQDQVSYKELVATRIIFCEGFYATQNPYFNWLPFNPVKGETLLVRTENTYLVKQIINQGSWVIPLSETECRIGATYSWHELDFMPTVRARQDLQTKIERFFKPVFDIREQQAGVRPATTDRRPFLGKHPQYCNLFIFNGLGTKGVSLAPYFARQFREFLLNEKEINSETTIQRFYTLY